MTHLHSVARAIKTVQAGQDAPVHLAQLTSPENQDPIVGALGAYYRALAGTKAPIDAYLKAFETVSVKEGRRPGFLHLLSYTMPDMTIMELEALTATSGGVHPNILRDPETASRRLETVEAVLKYFNAGRDKGEPEATIKTLHAFLEAKSMQAKLLGHEVRSPFISQERYNQMYDSGWIRRQVQEMYGPRLPLLMRQFGDAPEKRPETLPGYPNDSFALYRIFEISELGRVASGGDIAPRCQASGNCYTAVGFDMLAPLTVHEAMDFLSLNDFNLRDKDQRRDLARILSEPFFAKPETKALERFGAQERAPREMDARGVAPDVLPLLRTTEPRAGREL